MDHVTMIMHLSRMVCHPFRLGLAMISVSTKFEVSISIRYEDMSGHAKCRNLGSFGLSYLWVSQGH